MGVTRYTHHYTPPLHSPLHTFALHPPLHPQWVCYRGCNSLHYTTSVTLSVTLCVTWLCCLGYGAGAALVTVPVREVRAVQSAVHPNPLTLTLSPNSNSNPDPNPNPSLR